MTNLHYLLIQFIKQHKRVKHFINTVLEQESEIGQLFFKYGIFNSYYIAVAFKEI